MSTTLVIKRTTDGRFVGQKFQDDDNVITLGPDEEVRITKRVKVAEGHYYVCSSNYIIEAVAE